MTVSLWTFYKVTFAAALGAAVVAGLGLAWMTRWEPSRIQVQAMMPKISEFANVLRGFVSAEGPTNLAGDIIPTPVALPAMISAQDEIAYYTFTAPPGRLLVALETAGRVRVGIWTGTAPQAGNGVLRACGALARATVKLREPTQCVAQIENPPARIDGSAPPGVYPLPYIVEIRRWRLWRDVWYENPFWSRYPDEC